MRISVKLFAAMKQAAGENSTEIELPEGATIADLRKALIARHPALAPLADHVMFAVNADYATEETLIRPDAEVACIPPVSGG